MGEGSVPGGPGKSWWEDSSFHANPQGVYLPLLKSSV